MAKPKAEPLPDQAEEHVSDPAKDEKLRRCRVCGMPDGWGNRVLAGVWTHGSIVVTDPKCEHCILELQRLGATAA